MEKFNLNTDFYVEAQETCEVANPKDSMERLTEEARFEVVCKELDKGIKKPGLWLKAKTGSKGNIDMAEAIYAGLRVQSLKDEEDMLRAGSEAKIARKERVKLAREAEAARVAEVARLAKTSRLERKIQRTANAKVSSACDMWQAHRANLRSYESMHFLRDCGYDVVEYFMSFALNGIKAKKYELIDFAKEVRKKKEYISFRR